MPPFANIDGPGLMPSSVPGESGSRSHKIVKYPYIDALRGYAVLLVILSHTGGMFPELPYPIRKLTNLGWCGVQLFFLVSCVTLMMSWRSDERKGTASPASFWIRRYFRIAPMYYLAALFYLVVHPPARGLDLRQMAASLTFINAWHPVLLPTVEGGWGVVPGGWSISVEFSFYIIFPLIVTKVRTARAGIVFSALAIALAIAANDLVLPELHQKYGETATNEFLYYWLPEQLFVFAFGTLLFFLVKSLNRIGPPAWVTWRPSLLICILVAAIIALGEHPPWASGYWSLVPLQGPPTIFYVSLAMMAIATIMAVNPRSIWINRPIRMLGTVSFSAYIFHFFVLGQLGGPRIFDAAHMTEIPAMFTCGIVFVITLPITYGIAWLTYRFIEAPMIAVGSKLALRFGRRSVSVQ